MNGERSALAFAEEEGIIPSSSANANALRCPFILHCSFADVTGRGRILSGFRCVLRGLPVSIFDEIVRQNVCFFDHRKRPSAEMSTFRFQFL